MRWHALVHLDATAALLKVFQTAHEFHPDDEYGSKRMLLEV